MAGASQKTPKCSKNGKIMQQRLGNCIINYLKQSRQIQKKKYWRQTVCKLSKVQYLRDFSKARKQPLFTVSGSRI